MSASAASVLGQSCGDPAQLTDLYIKTCRLDYSQKMEDGFRETGGRALGETSPPGSSLAAATHVIVDRRKDAILVEFLNRTSKKLVRANDLVTKVMVTSLLVSEALGRSGDRAVTVNERCEQLVTDRMDRRTGTIHLGELLGDILKEAKMLSTKNHAPGAGTARHRAVLFKALFDFLNIAPCALCRDSSGCAWNTVLLDCESYVVDVKIDPGALYEEGSGKAAEYLKRLEHENIHAGEPRWRDTTSAPSVQQNLGGRMLRPSWHVEPWEVEFDRRDRAGRGGFGEVFSGTWASETVAVKEVRDANPTDRDICDFILEISLLSGLSHPNVIRFWRGCVDLRSGHRTLLLVTEWMDRGVLSAYLHESQEPNLSFGQNLALATGIARGVAYLHDVKILHLDLKSPNVLLNSSWQSKLCDFGLAKLREQTASAMHTTLRGVSPIWAPPEVFDEKAGGVTFKADVYSFGIIFFEVAARELPFKDISHMQLPRMKAKGTMPKFPPEVDANLVDLIKLCLSYASTSRPMMPAIIGRIQQLAKSRSIDLQAEQSRMERHGLHFGGPSGSMPNMEQLKRAQVEARHAELEVARLREVLKDEETKVQKLEQRVLENIDDTGEGGQKRIEQFLAANTQDVGDSKFRCGVCRKLFRGPDFVQKHLREKHLTDMLGAGFSPAPRVSEQHVSESNRKGGADLFFDADIAEESDVRLYTNKIGGEGAQQSRFNQVLQDAAQSGDLSKLQQCLLQGGVLSQADLDGSTPLHMSSKSGAVECVSYMISNGCNVSVVNDSGWTPLHLAAQEGRASVCELLLQAGADVNYLGSAKARSALHLSAAGGHRDVCRLLLMQKASVNFQDKDGESPLHNGARFGDRELCEDILSWGGNVALVDNDGWTPLHEAARWGDGALVASLLLRGADVHARSNDGESPLHVVPGGYAEFVEVVEVLLLHKCDVNGKDYDGETPLHVAVKLGDVELSGVMLEHGADVNAGNLVGGTPLDCAKKDEIKWLLRSYKARKGTGAQ